MEGTTNCQKCFFFFLREPRGRGLAAAAPSRRAPRPPLPCVHRAPMFSNLNLGGSGRPAAGAAAGETAASSLTRTQKSDRLTRAALQSHLSLPPSSHEIEGGECHRAAHGGERNVPNAAARAARRERGPLRRTRALVARARSSVTDAPLSPRFRPLRERRCCARRPLSSSSTRAPRARRRRTSRQTRRRARSSRRCSPA